MYNKKEISALKQAVYEANMLLVDYKLVIHTWGNVSGITQNRDYLVIKPSGVAYQSLQAEDMVIVEMATGRVIDSQYQPSSDTPTHRLIYLNDNQIQGIVHTHSPYAVAWAQAGEDIPCFGTTHADNFYGSVPCTRELSEEEIAKDYEYNTGIVIIQDFEKRQKTFEQIPAVLVKEHGPFTFSTKSPKDAVDLALTLEEVAKMAIYTMTINPRQTAANQFLQDKHYWRKHGKNAYYGQKNKAEKSSS